MYFSSHKIINTRDANFISISMIFYWKQIYLNKEKSKKGKKEKKKEKK